VRETRVELREQLKIIEAKLALLDLLAEMTVEQKLDLLFGLIDLDRSGTVDAQELAIVLRSRNQNLTDGGSISRAVNMVKAFDEDGNAELDRDEFRLFFGSMASHMGLRLDELAEYLSLELSFAKDQGDGDGDSSSSGSVSSGVRRTSTEQRRRRGARLPQDGGNSSTVVSSESESSSLQNSSNHGSRSALSSTNARRSGSGATRPSFSSRREAAQI
jgi:hypothetical protein